MDKKQTSRGRILDAVNLMCEQVAIASHCQELINIYTIDIKTFEEWKWVTVEDLTNKLMIQKNILEKSVSMRRSIMSKIAEMHPWDHHVRCSLKHALWLYQFATEVLYANPDDIFWIKQQQECYEIMIGVLWLFCGVKEFVTCGRCLEDELNWSFEVTKKASLSKKK